MDINLNKAHRLIHQLDQELQGSNRAWNEKNIEVVTKISVLKLKLSKDNNLDSIVRDKLTEYISMCDDYVLLKSKLLEANVSCNLHNIIARIDMLNKQIKEFSSIVCSDSVLSVENIDALEYHLGPDNNNLLDEVQVSRWDKNKLADLVMEYKQKLNKMLNMRDLLNNSQTINVAELSDYTKKLLGL